jgi:hypothetical protein
VEKIYRGMDKIKKYELAIVDFLSAYATAAYGDDPSGLETQVVIDRENHHYLLVRVGWDGDRHLFYCPFHIDIKVGKVWINVNNTEEMVGDELVKRGIPKTEIVLAFHPQDKRKYTGFVVA